MKDRADDMHDLGARLLVPAVYVLDSAKPACFQNAADGAAVVIEVQPVSHLPALAIDRQRLARQGVDDHQRDELFEEVVGAVVVATVGGKHRQAIVMVQGVHQVAACGMACKIRAVGFVAVGFCKCRFSGRERAVDFVGADVQEVK